MVYYEETKTNTNIYGHMSDDIKIEIAFANSYKVIILGVNWEDIMDGDFPYFIHNPARRVPKVKDIRELYKYYTETRDFKKCIAIRNYIKEKQITL